jgi:L-threonylcarbamoyladenylate synthase
VLCCDWQQVEDLVIVPETERPALRRLWPGPLTAVMRLRDQLPASGSSTLAVRIPGHDLVRALLYRTGPLTGTSANRSGAAPAVDVDAALGTLHGEPDLALDGGLCPGGGPTTIVDLTKSPVRVLRQGAIRWYDTWSTKP